MSCVKYIDFTFDATNFEDSARYVIHTIRPQWQWTSIKYEALEGGYTNHLWAFRHNGEEKDIVVLKIYGENTYYIDHKELLFVLESLVKRGICQPIYLGFQNGLCCKYASGIPITATQMVEPKYYRMIIQSLHKIHEVDIHRDLKATPKAMVQDYIGLLVRETFGTTYDAIEEDKKLKYDIPSVTEVHQTYKEISNWNQDMEKHFPICLCHGDLIMQNILYDKTTGSMSFIDWDLTCVCSEIIDIGIHWERDPEQTFKANNIDIVNDDNFKQRWIKTYLETHPRYQQQVITDSMIDEWVIGSLKGMFIGSFFGFSICVYLMIRGEDMDTLLRYAKVYWDSGKRIKQKLAKDYFERKEIQS